MRNLLFTVLMVLAFSRVALAVSWLPVPCDSTSYVYYTSAVRYSSPLWELWSSTVSAHGSASSSTVSAHGSHDTLQPSGPPQAPARHLFTLPEGYLDALNPVPAVVKVDKLEYYVRLKSDITSPIYFCRDMQKLTSRDSARMFMPFDTRNLDDYTVKQFGIRARNIDLRKPLPPHFHIDISGNPIQEQYPWAVIVPVGLGLVLVLLAMFNHEGYISRIFSVTVFHNAFLNRQRERNINADRSGALLFANYLLSVPLLAIVAIYRYGYQLPVDFYLAFVGLIILVLLVYGAKSVISLALAQLFGCRDVFVSYYHNVSYLMQASGVFLLVMNIMSFYINKQGIHDFVFYTTLVGCAVAEFLKIFRLIKIIFDKHFSYFYLFLYLCGVEILPVLLAIKILSH